jgi:hypothetical protein
MKQKPRWLTIDQQRRPHGGSARRNPSATPSAGEICPAQKASRTLVARNSALDRLLIYSQFNGEAGHVGDDRYHAAGAQLTHSDSADIHLIQVKFDPFRRP